VADRVFGAEGKNSLGSLPNGPETEGGGRAWADDSSTITGLFLLA
jgi:hypothetical protein